VYALTFAKPLGCRKQQLAVNLYEMTSIGSQRCLRDYFVANFAWFSELLQQQLAGRRAK
jgi:hypothetical protein